MFRAMRRFRQQVSDAECRKILTEEKRAAFSVIGDDGYPYTVPVNFYFDETDNCIYIHGARTGHKAESLKACDKVCFTTWNQGFKKEGAWEWNATSVVVFGKVKFIDDQAVIRDKLMKMVAKYYPAGKEAEADMSDASIKRVQVFAIEIEHMTGKLVNEK